MGDSVKKVVTGVLFSRSVRSSFASLTLAPIEMNATSSGSGSGSDSSSSSSSSSSSLGNNNTTTTTSSSMSTPKNAKPMLVRLQFSLDQVKELRSHSRREYKIGDLLELQEGTWQEVNSNAYAYAYANANDNANANTANNNSHQNIENEIENDDAIHNSNNNNNKSKSKSSTEWNMPRMVLDVSSIEQANQQITIQQSRFWNMTQCQEWQNLYFPKENKQQQQKQSQPKNQRQRQRQQKGKGKVTNEGVESLPSSSSSGDNHSSHGGGLGKRIQGEHIANFLIRSIMHKIASSEDQEQDYDDYSSSCLPKDPSEWSQIVDPSSSLNLTVSAQQQKQQHTATTTTTTTTRNIALRKKALEYLNSGSGVVDVAGGSGHVSMALGLAGVQSTVVDARSGVGKLPGRDRKIWNRAIKKANVGLGRLGLPLLPPPTVNESLNLNTNTNTNMNSTTTTPTKPPLAYCQPVVPFQAYRAWFGVRPQGVDATYRHPDEEELPLLDEGSELLKHASAIVALHPDEATGDIVRLAASQKIPLVVVPCCVFGRLFPERRKALDQNQVVSTYDDLLEYLMAHDTSIQKADLPFQGKNTVLWSTF